MTKKDKKGVPTKTDGKTILEQVPSDKMDDFVKGLVDLMNNKKTKESSKLNPIVHSSEEVNDDGEIEIIEPTLSSLTPKRKKIRINDDL